jgi:hypothetical protein
MGKGLYRGSRKPARREPKKAPLPDARERDPESLPPPPEPAPMTLEERRLFFRKLRSQGSSGPR